MVIGTTASAAGLDRQAILDRFSRMRARTRALFDLIDPDVYYERPISVRNPVVFYEGHLPAFAVNTLIKKALGRPGIDEQLERIFARGIDPESEADATPRGNPAWPSRQAVREYAEAADHLIADAIAAADLEREDHPLLHRAQALWAILEHEEMHQETLAYIWHQVPYAHKRKPHNYYTVPPSMGQPPAPARVLIPAGAATLGTSLDDHAFAWDNERPPHVVHVDPFEIDVYDVTNRDFMAFVNDGGYGDARWWRPEDRAWVEAEGVGHPAFWDRDGDRWYWQAMFERVPLPEAWPVYVTWAEAHAFARWSGRRLPTEAEFHRAAYGTPDGRERAYPWGNVLRGVAPGNFDFRRWDPERVGAHPEGASAFGVHDLVGNGWEWTSSTFAPFDGFEPLPSYPEYSAEFFDDDHFVMKGASPVTARALTRRGFRNWFRPRYPYVYATFRCVTGVEARS
jgi:gamma-glutamyl hercynylcysteine S-oxide synthase